MKIVKSLKTEIGMIQKRSKSREKFLDKMFNTRQQLKNKFNYYEKNPWESRVFKTTLVAYRIDVQNPHSVQKFSKVWRRKMDGMFNIETSEYKRELITEMIHKERENSRRPRRRPAKKVLPDPLSRLLLNYDREVLAMMRETRREFNLYHDHPHHYHSIEAEKRLFLNLELRQFPRRNEEFMDIDVDINGHEFKKFWRKRIAILCDDKIKTEKNGLRLKWRFVIRNRLRLSQDLQFKDVQHLFDSDVDQYSDVEIVEHQPSIIDVSSDEDY